MQYIEYNPRERVLRLASERSPGHNAVLDGERVRQRVPRGAFQRLLRVPWHGAGLATPEFEDATLLKAVRWALSSAAERTPCLTVLVFPAWKTKEIHKLLSTKDGFSQLLASVPGKCLELRPSNCGPARMPTQRANDSVIANAAGHASFNKQSEKFPALLRALDDSCSRAATKRGRPAATGEENVARVKGSVHRLTTPTSDDGVGKGHKHRRCVFSGQWRRKTQKLQTHPVHSRLQNQEEWPVIEDLAQRKPAFDANTVSVIFTDGSLLKGKPAGAGVHAMDGSQPDASFVFSGVQTVLRAELAAIQFALERAQDNPKRVVIATDSLTSLQLVTKGIHAPHKITNHRHCGLLTAIVRLLKVRNSASLEKHSRRCEHTLEWTEMRRPTRLQRAPLTGRH